MKEVRPEELVSAVPVKDEVKKMTRQEKLLHLAKITREHVTPLWLAHNLEHIDPRMLHRFPANYWGFTIFALAMEDKAFREQGLKAGNPEVPQGSVGDVMGFLEVTQQDMHEFSCNCGGTISNEEAANRIERIAHRGGGGSGQTTITVDSSAWTGRRFFGFGRF